MPDNQTAEDKARLALAAKGLTLLCGIDADKAALMAQLLEAALGTVMDTNIELASRFDNVRDKALVSSYFILSIEQWLEDSGRLNAARGIVRFAQLETELKKGE